MRWGPRARTVGRLALVGFMLALLVVPVLGLMTFRVMPAPFSAVMVGRALEGTWPDRRWRALDQLSPALVRAVVASEDSRFCTHGGVDWTEVSKAVSAWSDGGRLRGASTISMQTARNLFLWTGRGWLRKGLEVWFTFLVETLWPKQRILEVYLNIVEWGPGVFGAEAAARHHFGVSAARLRTGQAAGLAAILPNPTQWSPRPSGPVLRSRVATIRARMRGMDGHLSCVGATG